MGDRKVCGGDKIFSVYVYEMCIVWKISVLTKYNSIVNVYKNCRYQVFSA